MRLSWKQRLLFQFGNSHEHVIYYVLTKRLANKGFIPPPHREFSSKAFMQRFEERAKHLKDIKLCARCGADEDHLQCLNPDIANESNPMIGQQFYCNTCGEGYWNDLLRMGRYERYGVCKMDLRLEWLNPANVKALGD